MIFFVLRKLNWMKVTAYLLLPVYTFFLNNRQKRLRSSGGIAIGIKSEYVSITFNFTHHSEYMSWFSLHQEMTGLNEDLTVGVVYISPI